MHIGTCATALWKGGYMDYLNYNSGAHAYVSRISFQKNSRKQPRIYPSEAE